MARTSEMLTPGTTSATVLPGNQIEDCAAKTQQFSPKALITSGPSAFGALASQNVVDNLKRNGRNGLRDSTR
jgi:hypothetical protein